MCFRTGLADLTAEMFVFLVFSILGGSKLPCWAQVGSKVMSRRNKNTCKARASYLIMVPSYDVLKVQGGWGARMLRSSSGELIPPLTYIWQYI